MRRHRDFLAVDLLEEFPQHRELFDQVVEKSASEGAPERAARRFVRRVCELYLGEYERLGELSGLAPFIEFVNRRYEEDPDFRPALSTSFIDRLPDPLVDTDLAALLSDRVRARLDERWDWRQEPVWQQFVVRVCGRFPQFQTYADDNAFGRERDVLAMIFLIDVKAHCVSNVIDGAPERVGETRDLIEYLESEYGQNERLDYLIADSFVDNFPYENQPGHDIIKLLTPKLAAAYRGQRPYEAHES